MQKVSSGFLLAASGPHLFVTRAATLEYQTHTRGRFEEARRELTERILATPEDADQPGTYLLRSPGMPTIRAYTKREHGLLVVPKIEAL